MPTMGQIKLNYLLFLGLMMSTTGTLAGPKRNTLPDFLKVCHRDSPDLNQCARENFEMLKPRFGEGVPELFIPPLEPLVVPEIRMDQDSGAIYLHSKYKNVQVSGISKHKLHQLAIDPAQHKFTVKLTFPKLHLESDYSMKGKIMMMPLIGDGHCMVDLTNITLHTELFGQEYSKNGVNYLKIKDIKLKYELSNVKMRLDNLFNGDKALGQRMNDFLNENWKSLAEEVRPLMEKALTDILRVSIEKLFSSFSYDELLPAMNE